MQQLEADALFSHFDSGLRGAIHIKDVVHKLHDFGLGDDEVHCFAMLAQTDTSDNLDKESFRSTYTKAAELIAKKQKENHISVPTDPPGKVGTLGLAPPRPMLQAKDRQSSKNVFEMVSDKDQAALARVANGGPSLKEQSTMRPPPPRPMLSGLQRQSSKNVFETVSPKDVDRLAVLAEGGPSLAEQKAAAAGTKTLGLTAPPRPMLQAKNRQSSKNVFELVSDADKEKISKMTPPQEKSMGTLGLAAPPRPMLRATQRQSSKNVFEMVTPDDAKKLAAVASDAPGATLRAPSVKTLGMAPPRPMLKPGHRQSSKNVFEMVSPADAQKLANLPAEGASSAAASPPPGTVRTLGLAPKGPPRPMLRAGQRESSTNLLGLAAAEPPKPVAAPSPPPTEPAPPEETQFKRRTLRQKTEAVEELETGFFGGAGGEDAPAAPAPSGGAPPSLGAAPLGRSLMKQPSMAGGMVPRPMLKQRQSSKSLLSLVPQASLRKLEGIADETIPESPTNAAAPDPEAPPSEPPAAEPAEEPQFKRRTLRQKTEAVEELETGFFGGGGGGGAATDAGAVPAVAPRPMLKQRMSSKALLTLVPEASLSKLQTIADEAIPESEAAPSSDVAPAPPTDAPAEETQFKRRTVRQKTEAVEELETGFFGGTGSDSPAAVEAAVPPPAEEAQFKRRTVRQKTEAVEELEGGFFSAVGSEDKGASLAPPAANADDGFKRRTVRQKTEAVEELETGFFAEEPTPAPAGNAMEEMARLAQMVAVGAGGGAQPASEDPVAGDQFSKRTVRQKTAAVQELEGGFFADFADDDAPARPAVPPLGGRPSGGLPTIESPRTDEVEPSPRTGKKLGALEEMALLAKAIEAQQKTPREDEAASAPQPEFAKRTVRQQTEEVAELEGGFFSAIEESTPAPVKVPEEGEAAEPQFTKRTVRQKTEEVSELEGGFFSAVTVDTDPEPSPEPQMDAILSPAARARAAKKRMSVVAEQEDEEEDHQGWSRDLTGVKEEEETAAPEGEGEGVEEPQFVRRTARQKTEDVAELEDGFFSAVPP